MNRKQRRANSANSKANPSKNKNVEALQQSFNQACELHNAGNIKAAEEIYRKILEVVPGHLLSNYNLGCLLLDKRFFAEASIYLRKAIEIKPDHYDSYNNLGLCLTHMNRYEEGEKSYREAIKLKPETLGAWNNLGNNLNFQGRIEEAEEAYRKTLEIAPELLETYRNITLCKKYSSSDDEDAKILRSILSEPDCSDENKIHLNFALGKIYDDVGMYEEAFACFKIANDTVNSALNIDLSHTTKHSDHLISSFNKSFFKDRQGFGASSEAPVFIVGLPRSGKSLVEKVLSRHPNIDGVGEMNEIQEISSKLPSYIPGCKTYSELIGKIDKELAVKMAEEYLGKLLLDKGDSALRVTNTAPNNYLYFALIYILFPKAKIIHCRRDVMDNCLYNYFRFFKQKNLYTYDLENMAFAYNEYNRLMTHWKSDLPIEMFEINYEDLVVNTEERTKDLLNYLGLEWSDECLLDEPLRKEEIGHWKNYEKHLDSLKNSIKK